MSERVVLITGASSGLGEAAARRLGGEPDTHVVLVARRAERLEALAATLPSASAGALLPLLRAGAPSAVVNVASTAGRIGRPGAGAYSASKAALAVWSDALRAEEHAHDVHVGLVMPGFIPTEGFPQSELRAKRATRWMLGTPEQAADAIAAVALDRRAERYVPRFYGALAALRTVAPPLLARVLRSKRADVL